MANMPEKNVKEACRLNQIDTCLDSWHRISWIGQSESLLAVSGAVLFYPFLLCFSQDIWHFSWWLMAWRPRPLSAQAKLHGVNVSLMDSSFESRIFQVAMGFLQCSDLYDLGATPRVTPWLRKPPDVRPSLGRDFVRHSGFVFFWFAGNVTRALKQNSMIKHHSRTEGANCCGLAMDGACPTLRSTRRWCLSPLHLLRFHQPLLFASSLSLYLFT